MDNEIQNGGFVKGDLAEIAYPITRRHVGEELGMGEEGNDGDGKKGEIDIKMGSEGETEKADVESKDVEPEHEHVETNDDAAEGGDKRFSICPLMRTQMRRYMRLPKL